MKFSVERIVGGTPEQKKQAKEILLHAFENQDPEGLHEIEVEKSPEVIECIDIANLVTSEVLERYGIEREDISEDKIHIVEKEAWPEHLSETAAFFRLMHQFIIVPDGEVRIKLAKYLIHEIFHFKSYLSAQVLPNDHLDDYRIGLTVTTRDGVLEQFVHLNEALTEELTYEAMHTASFKNAFEAELKRIENDIKQNPDAELEGGGPLFNDQTFYVEVGEERQDGSAPISTSQFTYQTERKGLKLFVQKLYDHNKSTFRDPQEVLSLFIKSAFTGDILEIGRLIDGTFGVGTFRSLSNPESADAFLKIIEDLK